MQNRHSLIKGKVMKNKLATGNFKTPIVLTVLVLLFISMVLIVNRSDNDHSEQIRKTETPMQDEHDSHNHTSHSAVSDKGDDHTHMANHTDNTADTNNATDTDNNSTMPRHQDMLTEEMKEAIRGKLLFHGPMEVIEHPDGRIELPSNGRFTQMPVAVKMPDGTIQIKEYSSLPE
jgi:hypothetical protein